MKLFPKLNSKDTVHSIFLYLTILTCVAIVWPYLDVQIILPQGDIGRDLYASERILHGERPYRDFWWVYGPLMPYYFAIFYKLFGVGMLSIILGKLLLFVINSVLFFLILLRVSPPVLAFLGAVYYLVHQNDFHCTFSHFGGLTLILFLTLMVAHYLQSLKRGFLYAALIAIVVLALVKLNFGIVGLAGLVSIVFLNERLSKIKPSPRFYLLALIATPLIIFISYLPFVWGLSATEIRQCLPFLPGDQPYETSMLKTAGYAINDLLKWMVGNPFNIFMSLSAITGLVLMFRQARPKPPSTSTIPTAFLLLAGYVGLSVVFNLHEYLRSAVSYRLYWAQPQLYLLMFLMVSTLSLFLKPLVRRLLWLTIFLICSFETAFYITRAYYLPVSAQKTVEIKTEHQYFPHAKMNVYLAGNSPFWIETVLTAHQILAHSVGEKETFFALPYDPLYYYLMGQKSPTRQLIFFDHIHVTPEQEKSVIADLEKNRTNWILMSSRIYSNEHGLGVFGRTYCPTLAEYIYKNFHVVHELGDWTSWPGWADPHGVRILKRDTPL